MSLPEAEVDELRARFALRPSPLVALRPRPRASGRPDVTLDDSDERPIAAAPTPDAAPPPA